MLHKSPGFPRQDNRYGVQFSAVVLFPDGSELPVQVANISSHGCQLTTAYRFEAGERIVIELQKWERLNAEVRWCADGRAGVHFTGTRKP